MKVLVYSPTIHFLAGFHSASRATTWYSRVILSVLAMKKKMFKISVNKFLLIWFLRKSEIQLRVHTPPMYTHTHTHTHTSVYLFFKELIFTKQSFNKQFKTPFYGSSVLDERVVR